MVAAVFRKLTGETRPKSTRLLTEYTSDLPFDP